MVEWLNKLVQYTEVESVSWNIRYVWVRSYICKITMLFYIHTYTLWLIKYFSRQVSFVLIKLFSVGLLNELSHHTSWRNESITFRVFCAILYIVYKFIKNFPFSFELEMDCTNYSTFHYVFANYVFTSEWNYGIH